MFWIDSTFIALLLKTIKSLLPLFKNLVIIDDGSIDKTYQIANNYNLSIIKHPINLGQGAALETGLYYFLSKDYS